MIDRYFFVIILALSYAKAVWSTFTCQATSGLYTAALAACPDQGSQQYSSGGNVTIRVLRATNLPNKDSTGPAAGISDPYVKFSTATTSVKTSNIRDSLNPVWDETISLGYLVSASEITVEIWDKDSGLEFGDDLLVSAKWNVPFCSMFYANNSELECSNPFDCRAEDSMWHSPVRKQCNETGSINFNTKYRCIAPKSVCLYLEVHITPFQIAIDYTYPSALAVTPTANAFGTIVDQASWTSSFAAPFISNTLRLDPFAASSLSMRGALMLTTSNADKSYGAAEAIKYYASVNFPATVYVCRYEADNAKGVPQWLVDEYEGRFVNIYRLLIRSSDGLYFNCYFNEVSGTEKNEWGGVVSGAISFRTNTLPGKDTNSAIDQNYYAYNYIVLALPHLVSPPTQDIKIVYDAGGFLDFFGSYGLIWCWFMFLVANFLRKINYRLDRISNFLATRVLTGVDKSVLAGLFRNINETPCNVEYRAHLYHGSNIILFCILLPFGLLFSWGISCAAVVRPPALGIGITFIGASLIFAWYGMRLWENSNWRLSTFVVSSLALSFISFTLFMLIALFLDPGVLHYGDSLDIAGLSLIFAALNCVPCILLIFKQDRSQSLYLELVVGKIADAVHSLKNHTNPNGNNVKDIQINRVLHGLLGEKYSINPKLPALKYAGVMEEIKPSFNTEMHMAEGGKESESYLEKLLTEERKLYVVSMLILFVYFIIAATTTTSASLAFLNVCSLILLDVVHLSMSKGDNSWSPGFKSLLLILGRMLICGSTVSLWVLNYAACYTLYSLTLIHELIQSILPTISKRKAGEIVFGGGDSVNLIRDMLRTDDLAGGAGFSLGLLTICFLSILIISAFIESGDTTTTSPLLVPDLNVWGSSWPVYVFGIMAFLVTIIIGLLMATKRAFELDGHGLLQGWAKDVYLFRKDLQLPTILALSSEFSIILSGLLIYAMTGAGAIAVGCIYIPAIFLCFGYAGKVWVQNDFVLVHWPRIDNGKADEMNKNRTGTAGKMSNELVLRSTTNNDGGTTARPDSADFDQAFSMIENLFGSHDSSNLNNMNRARSPWLAGQQSDLVINFDEEMGPDGDGNPETNAAEESLSKPEKTLKGFTLPPMKVTGNKVENQIKMPPLPLKSVLRRKRQNLGIKVQSSALPIVTDLRLRDNTVNPDTFGNKEEDVIDINDPWAQFELTEEEEMLLKKQKKKGVTLAQPKNEPFMKRFHKAMKKNSYLNYISSAFTWLYETVSNNVKVHPSTYKPDLEGDEYDTQQIELYKDDEKGSNVNIDGMVSMSSKSKKSRKMSISSQENKPVEKKAIKEAKEETVVEVDEELDINKLTLHQAFVLGYLERNEYSALCSWYGGMFLIMLFGITLAEVVYPRYLGFIIWLVLWLLILVGVPIIKYFNIYTFDATSKNMLWVAAVVHFFFCVCFFGAQLEGDLGQIGSLWIFDFFIYFPVFSYIFFAALQWVDAEFKLPLLDQNRDGTITLKELWTFLRTFPVLTAMVILFAWQLYIWISITVGLVFTLLLIASVITYVYIKDWADNDHFLSPELIFFAKFMIYFTMFISFCVAVFRPNNPIFAISVFLFTWMIQYALKVFGRYMIMEKDALFYFAPYLFPIYSYLPSNQDVNEENDSMKDILSIFLLASLWGGMMTIFFYPMHIGIALSCGFILFATAMVALCVAFIPRQLAKSHSLIDAEIIKGAAEHAKSKSDDRKQPLSLEMKDFDLDIPQEVLETNAEHKTILEKLKERTCLENCVSNMGDIRSLKYVKEDKAAVKEAMPEDEEDGKEAAEEEEKDEYELTYYQKMWVSAKDYMRALYELLPVSKMAGYKKHSQAPFTYYDMMLEIFYTGRGPFGLFGPEGMWFKFCRRMRTTRDFSWMYRKWMDDYDTWGNHLNLVQLLDYIDYPTILSRSLDLDRALDYTYKEEARCAIHFLMNILVSADAKLQRETVLFQRFLRENRVRLAANGIALPRDIFSSESYTSINIPLVAVWLSMLTADEQSRFHTLKETFNAEQRERDFLISNSDAELVQHAELIRQMQSQRDQDYMSRMSLELIQHRERKVQMFAESLDGPERIVFLKCRELWTHDYDCYVDPKEMDLYEKFKATCLSADRNELLENAVHNLIEIEAAQKDIRLGEYGRSYQFVDSEFPPSEYSLGDGQGANYVLGWRCSPGVVEFMQLFDGGTHPDDVCEGVFGDGWLLSAISMLLAAGEFGKGLINERIRFLFIPHPSSTDSEPTLDTSVGAYCVRMYRNNDWIPVVVDDLLPMRKKEHWTNENRGMACAHNREGRGLWLPLIEKAFAKYYGSYAMLEQGYVHHALEDLTGCEAECMALASYAQGVNRRALWETLLRYKRNGYILGAGTGDGRLVDKEVLDLGICFNSAYTIYDVREVDGHRLLKLRNPPGDHEEWKGDWSDHSSLWTRRLKAKLGYSDDDQDNTFFMSFDDFLNVFRYLYTCKYYNPKKWIETKYIGFWKKSDEAAIEKMDLMSQFIAEQAESVMSGSTKTNVDQESMDRKKAKARLSSAGGLPSRHNPGCVLENNPHYSLRVFRPTDLNITVTQFNPKGIQSAFTILPFSILVVRNDHSDVPKRLTKLVKEDVLYSTGEPKTAKSQSLYVPELKPGLYMILVGAYLAGMEGNFNISLVCNYRTEFLAVWPPAWMVREERNKAEKSKGNALVDVTASIDTDFKSQLSTSAKAKRGMLPTGMVTKGLKAIFGKNNEDDLDDIEEEGEDDDDDDIEKGR